MNTDERTQTNIDTFITPATEAGGITLRPFSAGTLTICRALGLTMVVGGWRMADFEVKKQTPEASYQALLEEVTP